MTAMIGADVLLFGVVTVNEGSVEAGNVIFASPFAIPPIVQKIKINCTLNVSAINPISTSYR